MQKQILIRGNEDGLRRTETSAENRLRLRYDCHFDPGDWSARTSICEMEEQESCRCRKVDIEFCLRMSSGKLDLWWSIRTSCTGAEN